jgi:putative sigma-54 modulation protein
VPLKAAEQSTDGAVALAARVGRRAFPFRPPGDKVDWRWRDLEAAGELRLKSCRVLRLSQLPTGGTIGRFRTARVCGVIRIDWGLFEGAISVVINISARHGHLSETTQEKIRVKLEKMSRLFERLTAIDVTVDLEHRESPVVDLRVSAEHKHDFVADEQGGELMVALDAAIHKVEQQLRRYKEKVQEHRGPGLRQQAVPEVGGP